MYPQSCMHTHVWTRVKICVVNGNYLARVGYTVDGIYCFTYIMSQTKRLIFGILIYYFSDTISVISTTFKTCRDILYLGVGSKNWGGGEIESYSKETKRFSFVCSFCKISQYRVDDYLLNSFVMSLCHQHIF